MDKSSAHRTSLVYSLPAVAFGLVLTVLSIALIQHSANQEFSRWLGQVLAILVTPLIVVLARKEIRRGATYLHPRADLVALAAAGFATIVGTGVLQ